MHNIFSTIDTLPRLSYACSSSSGRCRHVDALIIKPTCNDIINRTRKLCARANVQSNYDAGPVCACTSCTTCYFDRIGRPNRTTLMRQRRRRWRQQPLRSQHKPSAKPSSYYLLCCCVRRADSNIQTNAHTFDTVQANPSVRAVQRTAERRTFNRALADRPTSIHNYANSFEIKHTHDDDDDEVYE